MKVRIEWLDGTTTEAEPDVPQIVINPNVKISPALVKQIVFKP